MRAKPTLVSLADAIGVSRQTISNVLNAPHKVKPETRDRVLAVIKEMGYRPSAAARQLRTRRSMDLGYRLMPVTDGINGAVLDRFLHALTEAAQEQGYRVTLYSAASDEEEIGRFETLLHSADLDGFVLVGTHQGDGRTAWLGERGVPFAAFGRPWGAEGPEAHPWVDIDGGAGTQAATEMLLAAGHHKVAFLGWPAGSGTGDDRREGWRRAMAVGTTSGSAWQLEYLNAGTEDSVTAGAGAIDRLIAHGATAVVCASDSLALGAAARMRATLPPRRRAAVVGFDDTPMAAAVGLSSISQPVEDAARHIIAVLAHTLAGGPPESAPQRHLLLTPTLVQRTLHPFGERP